MGQSSKIFITTAKRPFWCLNLLKELARNKGNFEVFVFHDKCGYDYSKVENYCKRKKGFYYLRTKDNMGRDGFWALNNLMYSILDLLDYDVYIQLVDDITLVENFVERAVEYSKHFELVVPGIINVHNKDNKILHKPKRIINGVDFYKTNWVDCSFIARREVMQGIRIENTVKHRAKHRGSGVGVMFRKAFYERGGKEIWTSFTSLSQHLGIEISAMHCRKRRSIYYGDVNFENDPLMKPIAEQDKEFINKKFLRLCKKGNMQNLDYWRAES